MTGRSTSATGAPVAAIRAPVGRHWLDVSPRVYKLMWDGHSVVGVFTGLALFVMFFCGSLALYRGEFHQWADPELRSRSTRVSSVDTLVQPILEAEPPAVGTDMLLVWPFGNRPYFYVQYERPGGGLVARRIVPESGVTLPPDGRSLLPDILNDMHFFAQFGRTGETLAGILGVVMLFALVTGLVIHLRKLPGDLHTFRPWMTLRVSLADAHTALGTIGIPFAATYSLTGAYLSLLVFVYGSLTVGTLRGERQGLDALLVGMERPVYEASGVAAPALPFDTLVSRFESAMPTTIVSSMEIRGWGDAAGQAFFEAETDRTLGASGVAVLNVATGDMIVRRDPRDTPPLTSTAITFSVLHFGRFGGQVLKACLFLLGLAGSAVILTGNILWIEVRKPAAGGSTPFVHRLLARLTSGIGIGLVAAIPVLFLTTRVVPINMLHRMKIEEAAFFGAWMLFAVMAILLPSAATSARILTTLAAVGCLTVPLADGLGTGAWPWVSARLGHWIILSIDISFLLTGIAIGWVAWRVSPRAHSR